MGGGLSVAVLDESVGDDAISFLVEVLIVKLLRVFVSLETGGNVDVIEPEPCGDSSRRDLDVPKRPRLRGIDVALP